MNLNLFASQKEQIDAIITNITQAINQLLQHKSNITIALSGGKSPIRLFKQLKSMNLAWEKITFTLVDERVIATTHPESNQNLIFTHLLKGKAQAAKFKGLITQIANVEDKVISLNQNPPLIDLAILGMGEDGHMASLFPDCPELKLALDLTNPNQYIITHPLSAKYPRVTLTLAALSRIPHLILSINGEIKLNILKEAMLGNSLSYPISHLISIRPDLKIYWHE